MHLRRHRFLPNPVETMLDGLASGNLRGYLRTMLRNVGGIFGLRPKICARMPVAVKSIVRLT